MDVFYPFIYETEEKDNSELIPLYVELGPPPLQEAEEENNEERIIIIEIL